MHYLLAALVLVVLVVKPVDAHFFGETQQIDGFEVIFAPYPSSPVIGESTTLNFSVLENGHNLINVYAAIKIQDGFTDEVIFQDPYKQYEISDITLPYVFSEPGRFSVTIETRILEHERYQAQPLSATFQISAYPPRIPFDELIIYYVAPATAAAAGIVMYLHSRNII